MKKLKKRKYANFVAKCLFQKLQNSDVVAKNVRGKNLVVEDYKGLEKNMVEEKEEKIFLIFVSIVEENSL